MEALRFDRYRVVDAFNVAVADPAKRHGGSLSFRLVFASPLVAPPPAADIVFVYLDEFGNTVPEPHKRINGVEHTSASRVIGESDLLNPLTPTASASGTKTR